MTYPSEPLGLHDLHSAVSRGRCLVCFSIICSVALQVSCDGPAITPASAPTIADSAGTILVTNHGYQWGLASKWRLDTVPRVSIAPAGKGYDLHLVGSVRKLSSAAWLVSNRGNNQLLFFDSAGAYLSSFGRKGSGPGEFQSLSRVEVLRGDTIVAFDVTLRRLTFLDSAGRLIKTVSVADLGPPPFHDYLGRFRDGTWIGAVVSIYGVNAVPGVHVDSISVFRVSPDLASVVGPIGAFALGSTLVVGINERRIMTYLPFAPSIHVAITDSALILADGGNGIIDFVDSVGHVSRRIVLGVGPDPVTSSMLREAREQELRETGRNRSAVVDQQFAHPAIPKALPVFSAVRVDALGFFWLRRFEAKAERPARYLIVTPAGTTLGEITTPAGFRIMTIGKDFLAGIRRDEGHLETVVVYDLVRN